LTDGGVPVLFLVGNRDFLVGKRFADASGVQMPGDPLVVDIGGVATLLSHGDPYCTDDRAYQRWRRFSRNRLAQKLFGLLPRGRRHAIAGGMRRRSGAEQRNKASAIMDVNDAAIRAVMQKHNVIRMIHGHTHRPADHLLQLRGGRRATRIVLADWRDTGPSGAPQMEYLAVDANDCRRVQLDRPPPAAPSFEYPSTR
jgi:UDP-2,3-diacylglucosamine hydrolase